MQSVWHSHLKNEKEKKDFIEYVRNSEKVLDRLKEIVYNAVKESEVKASDYDSPSWAYRQAHSNGIKEMGDKLIKVLTLDRE